MQHLRLSGRAVAEGEVSWLSLRPALGGYELRFGLGLRVYARDGQSLWFAFSGAQVMVEANNAKASLGICRTDHIFRAKQADNELPANVEMRLFLSPYQIEAIEQHCREGDMAFELTVIGEGGITQTLTRWPLTETLAKRVARSEWINHMRGVGAMDILLLEIPVPVVGAAAEQKEIIRQLRHAQSLYKQGHYTDCVGTCRKVMEELGKLYSRDKKWSAQALDRYQKDREGMTKEERELAMQAALFHYTCAGSHAEARGGSTNFDRDEARMTLTVTATFVGRLFVP